MGQSYFPANGIAKRLAQKQSSAELVADIKKAITAIWSRCENYAEFSNELDSTPPELKEPYERLNALPDADRIFRYIQPFIKSFKKQGKPETRKNPF